MMFEGSSAGKRYILAIAAGLVMLLIGGLVGYAITTRSAELENNIRRVSPEANEARRFMMHGKVLSYMDKSNIEEEARYFSGIPHMSGTSTAKTQASYVARKWRDFGVENVKTDKYDVLLSYPEKPAEISFTSKTGTVSNFTVTNEVQDQNGKKIVLPYNAYSPSRNVTGYLVYANYGTEMDFRILRQNGINVTRKIVIIRHGFPYRGQQVDYAHINGAIGVIFYSDPREFNPNGKSAQYPKGWELPDSGVHIGTVLERPGDPLSREYPSKQGYYRMGVSKASPVPRIPSQPVPFKYAKLLLEAMDGRTAPKSFEGNGNFTYKMDSTLLVSMNVQNKLETKTLRIISGMIYGEIEPDRIVLIGNHRDSWVYGASDASGAQATLLEIARCLGKARKSGWRPRRSVMLLSWDGHEHGIHGSTEWVEEHASMLHEHAVAYLNVDVAVEGNYTIDYRGTPELNEAFFDATKSLEEPISNENLYKDWVQKQPSSTNSKEPRTIVLITGSDYKPFYHTIGVSSIDFKYTYAKLRGTKYPFSNPMYHSAYDTFDWLKKFVDPTFRYHLLICKMWLKMTLLLADSTLLPFNLTKAANAINGFANDFKRYHQSYLWPQNISCGLLIESASNLTLAVKHFESKIRSINRSDALKVRMVNDRLQNFQRQLIHQTGTMGRDDLRNVVYSTRWDLMASRTRFTAISQAIFRAVNKVDPDWDEVKRQLMIATYRLQSAAQSYRTFQL